MGTKTYRITGIDSEVWSRFKAACAWYEMDMGYVLRSYIEDIAERYRWVTPKRARGGKPGIVEMFGGLPDGRDLPGREKKQDE